MKRSAAHNAPWPRSPMIIGVICSKSLKIAMAPRATIVTSQLPVDHWHEAIGHPTLADAILDRLIHNAYKISLKGESMRKRTEKGTTKATTEDH